jgi:hypothetical protein
VWTLEYIVYCEAAHFLSSGLLAALAYWLMVIIYPKQSQGLVVVVLCTCVGVLLHLYMDYYVGWF